MVNSHVDEFEYSYYDYGRSMQHYNGTLSFHVHSWPDLTRVVLVILLRIGFVMIHVGSVPVNNVNLILLQNIVDVCWVTLTYSLIGYLIAFNGDTNGVIGGGVWVGNAAVDKDDVLIGWSAVVIAAAICTCGIVGRTHTVGYLVTGFLLAALLQPFLIHWVWSPKGWMRTNLLNEEDVRFRDYAGSTIVHLVGGLSGLIGCMTLGRRILRLSALDDASIAAGTSGTVYAGELMVFIGLQSLSIPNDTFRIRSKDHGHVYLNNLLAASSCSVFVVAFHFMVSGEEFNHWTVMRCVQALAAGLSIVAAGTDFYSPQIAIVLGFIGSIVFFLVSKLIFQSALEDYCNIVATHVACAFVGSFLAPLFDIDTEATLTANVYQFFWQLICLITIITMVSIVMYISFTLLERFGLLRNRSEHLNHMRANVAMEALDVPRGNFFRRLFHTDDDPVYIQPGSTSDSARRPSVGTHAMKYQAEDAAIEKGRVVEPRPRT
ncbi:PREDICTED: ammonium transporter 1 member 3-like [Dufourea novaeangliae]|uniref:Ammonium transporter 1 member 3 n=1 Tax=Dufourea novaeangliae TaxID=178035 RepID=A0A154PE94_DUFNO|nr:PREDICTED: ammonium transporter 1 member 3-like [Dufourea novaeangliae]KZC09598.1 Ammonium transporter 1 member 3 [Dufourea novaeangliae]